MDGMFGRDTAVDRYIDRTGVEPVSFVRRVSPPEQKGMLGQLYDRYFGDPTANETFRHRFESIAKPSPSARNLRELVASGQAQLPFSGDPIAQLGFDPSVFSVYSHADSSNIKGFNLNTDYDTAIKNSIAALKESRKTYFDDPTYDNETRYLSDRARMEMYALAKQGQLADPSKRSGMFNIGINTDRVGSEGNYSNISHELRHRGIQLLRQLYPDAELNGNSLWGQNSFISLDLRNGYNSEEVVNRYMDLLNPQATEKERKADIEWLKHNKEWVGGTTDEEKEKSIKKTISNERDLYRKMINKLEELAKDAIGRIYQ